MKDIMEYINVHYAENTTVESKLKVMAKYYFSQHEPEYCYKKDYHLQYMKDNQINEMLVFEAKREIGSDMFFCKEVMEVGVKGEGDGCGNMCEHYKPRNGKSGRCKHSGYVYEQTEKSVILKIKMYNELEDE